jgi:two-component system phosphate regulon response regulator PhoB
MARPLAFVVEDDRDLATIFSEALQAAGCKAEVITSGDRALERLDAVVPFLVLLDLRLPGVTGQDVLAQIRADPRLEETRVIVATAHPLAADELRGTANLVLIKPVSFTQLRDLASRFVRGSTPPGE